MRRFLMRGVLVLVLCASFLATGWCSLLLDAVSVQAATSSAKIHFLTLPGNTEAILLECNGKFGMVDSGEDNDYPTGSDSRYPSRPGIVQGQGYEDRVISYMQSVGVTQNNFEFYIGTHPHSDHIGSADEVIRAFHPKRVYIQEYKDSYITNPLALWDNLYVYDNMIAAAKEVGATLIQNFDSSAPLYPETVSVIGTITWDDEENQDNIRPQSVTVTLTNPVSGKTQQLEVSPDSSGIWQYEFSDIQKYDDEKNEILYTVSLAAPDGYSISNATDFDFVCSHQPSSDHQDVTVTWDDASAPEGSRPDSLQVTLQKKTEQLSGQENEDGAVAEEESTQSLDDSSTDTSPIDQTQQEIWEDIDSFRIVPDASGSWSYSFDNLPQNDESGSPIEYRLQIENPPANYEISAASDPFSLHAVYTGPMSDDNTESGIQDSQPKDPANVSSTDDMVTDSIAAADRVDPTNTNDPTNIVDHQAPSARTGQFEDLSDTQNTTSTPVFTLGGDMKIEIMHYGGDYKTNPKPDANYFCLGVKVTANGKSAFLAGDINNYEGAETALSNSLGHVDILTLGHHGYYGSNTYGYLSKLSPKIMIMAGDYTAVSNNPSSDGSYGTLDTLLAMGQRGSLLYPTAWYSDIVPALVIRFDNSLSSNIPSGKSFVASADYVDPAEKIFYKDGLPTAYTGWLESDGIYYYFNASAQASKNQWIQSSGKYYYLTDDGSMLTDGWVLSNGAWYYLNQDGWMVTSSWVKNNGSWYYLTSDGSMAVGRKTIDGSTYYFDSDGRMVTSSWAGKEYFGSDGKLIPGYRNENWRHDANGWWYQRTDGSYPRNQWELIDGNWYYFNVSGYVLTGWQYIGNFWYYFDANGCMLTGWQKVGGTWYYMNGSGAMTTGWQLVNGTWYYMNGSGAMTTGWQFIGGIWYYMNSSGAMTTGWQKIGGTWYYMNSSGAMTTGWQFVGNTWYYMNSSGAMLTGWQKINGVWYYMNGSGAMTTGWQLVNGTWYYMNGSGAMTTGWQLVGNTWYYMNGSGAMMTGWQLLGGTWYYMNSSGAMTTGWQLIGGTWYYMNGSGAMTTGWQLIGGTWYYMNGSGAMLTGTHSIGGTTYHFSESGAWIG